MIEVSKVQNESRWEELQRQKKTKAKEHIEKNQKKKKTKIRNTEIPKKIQAKRNEADKNFKFNLKLFTKLHAPSAA